MSEVHPRDWFLPAIEADGSVGDSLDAVLGELRQRATFAQALRVALVGPHGGPLDRITDLGQRLKGVENTLRFRLGILRPERPHAWFRAPATTSTGPFATTLINDPVLAGYDPRDAQKVKKDLSALWTKRVAGPLPFLEDGPSLWKTLLEMNAELEKILVLPAPFEGLRLDKLPDELPPKLESRPLRAFLLNVRTEALSTRDRLGAAYAELFDACDRLWKVQSERATDSKPPPPKEPSSSGARAGRHPDADNMREEFRRRRVRTSRALSDKDLSALKFMGFDDLPDSEGLRQRYLLMAKRLHPDRGGNDGAFKLLTSAYAHLQNRVQGP